MPNTPVAFGWVAQPAPATAAGVATLNEDILRVLNLIRSKFQSVWFEDHFLDVGRYGHDVRLEAWTFLTFLLPQFPELRFGHLVLGLAYRHPALVAKMAATLQYLAGGQGAPRIWRRRAEDVRPFAGGRLILGIGAGWHKPEYDAYGWEFPSAGVRVAQLDEYAHIIKLMLTQSPVSFSGKYYTVTNAPNDPLPVPPIPLMIGGSGEKGTLRTTAKYADWWNFGLKPAADFAHKLDVLKQHCVAVGRDFNEITPTAFHFVNLSGTPSSSPVYTLGEDPDTVTRQLEEFVALGARHFMLRFTDFPSTHGIEQFLDKVLPRFRA